MKFRRIVSLMLALSLLLAMSVCAGAETAVANSWTLENSYVLLSRSTGVLNVEDNKTGLHTLMSCDGVALTTEPFISMGSSGTMFEVAVESGLNVFGMIDSTGKLMVPMQYGDTIYISDRWQLGVVLTEATADNYDYKTFDGKGFYLISGYDVYYQGAKVGTLDRLAYNMAYAYGAYLYVSDKEQNYTCYDSTMTVSTYVPSFSGSREYDETRDGIFHKGSGQQVGVPGCTLTSDDVDNDIFLIDGRAVDLQGNILFALDAKYESVYDFEGDYARVRMNGKYGLIDRTGREVLSCEYDEISSNNDEYFNSGYQIAVKDGKVGFVNPNGEVTCEFKYSKNNVKSTYKMPMTHLTDLDGSTIVLSGAVGELPTRFVEVNINNYGSPLFGAEPVDKKAGVYDMYGNEIIAADGLYDDCSDFQISNDGSVVVACGVDRVFRIYQLDVSGAKSPYDRVEMMSGLEGGTPVDQTDDEGWKCTCGAANTGKFCAECGAARSVEEEQPDDGSWKCSQGHSNTGKFCSECGEARPEEKMSCVKCGYEPKDGETPKFCPECGNAF